MFADIDAFIEELQSLKQKLLPESEIEINYRRIDKISLRITIGSDLFIDIYANTESNRYDFSLINSNSRIFGYDNLGGWHCHPLNKQAEHVPCKEPLLAEIMKEFADILRSS